ncbi:unnamed protein product [Symbiodinium sp. CCMP2592]|nr:unnamed protein product [Symbiodinium sp. CCMP2592]
MFCGVPGCLEPQPTGNVRTTGRPSRHIENKDFLVARSSVWNQCLGAPRTTEQSTTGEGSVDCWVCASASLRVLQALEAACRARAGSRRHAVVQPF